MGDPPLSLSFCLLTDDYRPIRLRALLALPVCSINAQKNYRENRENGEPIDNPKQPFPTAGFDALDVKSSDWQDSKKWPDKQGRYWWAITLNNGQVVNDFYWMEDKGRGFPDKSNEDRYWFTVHHANGTKIEGFSQEPDYDKGYPDKDEKYWRYIKYTECGAIKTWMEEKDKHYQIRMLIRILYQPPKIEDGFNLFAALPDELQLMVFEFVLGVKLTRDLFERAKNCAIRKEIFTKPTTLDLSKRKGKQKATSQPSLNDDTIQQLALSIEYKEIIIVQKLGEGAFGIVLYGQWRNEEVAIKQLRLKHMSENELMKFKKAAAIIAPLHSDYIVLLKGISLTPYALVMEYMHGGSLFNLLHSQTSLPWAMRQQVALDVAKGLAFLHSHQPNKILHCNLKSQNVLLTRDQRAKLADSGLAKVRSVGNIPWTAPECFMRKYGRKSDMYAYGMVLWELTTRRIPYEEVTDPNEICKAIKAGEREKIHDQITNPTEPIPVSIKGLIDLCWLQARRRPKAKEAIEILEQATQSQSSASQSASSSSSRSPSGFMSNLLSFKK